MQLVPEFRTDRLTGRSVIVAENRAERPNEFERQSPAKPVAGDSGLAGAEPGKAAATEKHGSGVHSACPFCPGQEHLTPPAVYEVGDRDGRWRLRVVPNKFPAMSFVTDTPSLPEFASCSFVAAVGTHEVIIESPRHVNRMSWLSTGELCGVLNAYALRLRHWRDDERLAYGLVFKNQGARAGASLEHVHSQFIALPAVPPVVQAEMRRAADGFCRHTACPYCRLVQNERSFQDRVIYDENGFIAFCPFASLQPYEVWLMPTAHAPSFEESTADVLTRLAGALHKLLSRVEAVVPDAAYNMLLRTAPWRIEGAEWSHWRIELLPRSTPMAGFELATGVFINSVAPERAASKLLSV